jgi:protein involved in polysaccharide export with SLBB domain
VSLLEVLAEAGGVANDAGDTVIVNRPSQETPSDPSEPPAIGPEDSASAAATKGSTHTGPAQEPASPTTAVPNATNSPAPADPPHLNSTITINLNQLMESGDATNNIILQAGDIVTVPHSGIVYVLGAVSRPGGFVLANDRGQMTTLKVLSLAGGLSPTARRNHAVIVRKDSQGQQHEVAVDLKKVMERQAEDVQLQPSDILIVPNSPGRQAMLRALEFGVALGSGVALYRVAYH